MNFFETFDKMYPGFLHGIGRGSIVGKTNGKNSVQEYGKERIGR